ncbi:hypothetical protein PybrP1_006733 [[Pythium] brassicae (nom. inval.)]|nr:hypothetical protein PybrP1_006733 [[Pythium] brassicae (nom. inval.)]
MNSSLSPTSPSFAPPAATDNALNPLLALQTVVAGELATTKQRSRAAHQLEDHLRALASPSPALFAAFEPYLPALVDIATAPAKAMREVQESVSRMLRALAGHSPHKFVEWIAQNVRAHPGHDVWFIEWTCGLLLETELRIPRAESLEPDRVGSGLWREKTMEFLEFDTALARVFALWRAILDYTSDAEVVAHVVRSVQYLLRFADADAAHSSQWQPVVLKKLQPHFVNIADVLIGWAMSASPHCSLREEIVSLLDALSQLWVDNSVFSAQLLSSFAQDIEVMAASEEALAADESDRLNTVTVCFMLVARRVPDLAVAASDEAESVLSRVLRSTAMARHGAFSESIRVAGDAPKEPPQKISKALLSFSSLNAPKLLAELVVLLILGEDALRGPTKARAEPRTYNLFCAACFILAIKSASPSLLLQGDKQSLDAVMKTLIKRWRARLSASDPCWYARLLPKLSRAKPSRSEIPQQYLQVLADKVTAVLGSPKSESSAACVRILKSLASRYGVSPLGPVVFGTGLDLVLDPDLGVDGVVMRQVLPQPALSMLVSREPSSRPKLVPKPVVGDFSATDFASILAAMSKRDTSLRAWRRLCATIHTRLRGQSDEGNNTASPSSNASLLLSTIRQAAAWCVHNRLRTHFGGPAQTFSSIERLLMTHASREQDSEAAPNGSNAVDDGQSTHRDAADSCCLSKSMVLEFVSALELYISNATFAASDEHSDPDSDAHKTFMFYRANKRVCEDWLSRIRPLLLDLSEALSRPELARHHAHAVVSAATRRLTRLLAPGLAPSPTPSLIDIQHSAADLDSALFVLCRSYCETKDVDSIVGFERWRGSLSSALGSRVEALSIHDVGWGESWDRPLFPWIKAMRLAAEMRYEDAATEYEGVLGAVLGCLKHCAACYAATRSWNKLRAFVAKFVALASSIEERGLPASVVRREFIGKETERVLLRLFALTPSAPASASLEQVAFVAALLHRVEQQAVDDVDGMSLQDLGNAVDSPQDVKGRLLAAATKISPSSREAWLQYSNWSYAKAKQETERLAARNGYIELNTSEEARLVYLLDALRLDASDRDAVVRCFLHLMETGNLVPSRHDTLRQLCLLRASAPAAGSDIVDQVVSLHKQCHARALRFHTLAVDGYGKYLSAPSTSAVSGRDHATSVVLRLLRLLTSFGAEQVVASAVEEVFADSPVAPWRKIVPQLLARAAHPIPAVASLICRMLGRVARHSPRLIVYPAVVDALSVRSKAANSNEPVAAAPRKLDAVLEALQAESGDLVSGVRLLVTELQRVSVLWDEAWVSTLHKLSADVSRRASTLEKEAARVEKNLSLSLDEKNDLARRKFVAIMKPILVSVERLWDETCGQAKDRDALTPHERLFLHQYGGAIEEAIVRLRDACTADGLFNVSVGLPGPGFAWNPFVEILKSLQSSAARNERLPLDEISPAMASVSTRQLRINMPDMQTLSASESAVSIREIRPAVLVLRTKTKPKCLEFVGSDGKPYKYLLKAREDLRLDERIMQFLTTVNEFLTADADASARDLSAQNYSVIPLSRDSGLIQMVPDVTPLFQVYLNWNEQASSGGPTTSSSSSSRAVPESPSNKLGGGASTSSHVMQQQPSPTAAFYSKLKQYGVADVSPNQRQRWPESVLRQVYHDLVAQRPRNILQQEIALGSGDVRESWSKTARLSKSLAVMSALGYIVGLGDRHLDNILLCSKTGDVLHIDYNVCFDKGLKLKVPEIVPFRLTPMLQDALGVTGVEGKFRAAFEAVLRIVRADDSREALLTLLEAFVYEPLVDWTGEESRKGVSEDLKSRLEVNVNLSLFLSRAEERRHDATEFEQQLGGALSDLSHSIDSVPEHVSELFADAAELATLERLEAKLSAELVLQEEKAAECEVVQAKRSAELSTAESRLADATSQVAEFATKCKEKHAQIAQWKQKIAQFSSSHSLADTLAASPQSQAVDAGVAHAKRSLEAVTGFQENDVYWRWWRRCEAFQEAIDARNVDAARVLIASSAEAVPSLGASASQVTDSLQRIQWLEHLEQRSRSDHAEFVSASASLKGRFEDQVQQLFSGLSALKLSNAQGQRLLKLAGATWLVTQLDRSLSEPAGEQPAPAFAPLLSDVPLFRSLLGAATACSALLDLVATPKGAMKRSRAADLLAAVSIDALERETAGSFSLVLGRLVEVLGRLQDVVTATDKVVVFSAPGMHDRRHATATCPAIQTVLQTLSALLEQFELLIQSSSDAGEPLSGSEKASWVALVLDICRVHSEDECAATSLATTEAAATRTMLRSHATTFLQERVARVFGRTVVGIIAHEWKFSFEVQRDADSSCVLERWKAFATSQLPDLFPSSTTLATDHESHVGAMEAAMSALMDTCSAYCVRVWEDAARERRMTCVGESYRYHRCKLWYSFWFSGHAPSSEYAGQMTQSQLLASLPAFVAELRRLSSEHAALGSLVLELAQQMEYAASQVPLASSELDLHSRVQACYSHASSLFELNQDITDLLQGISIVETSTAEAAQAQAQARGKSAELEVDAIGRAMQRECLDAMQSADVARAQILEEAFVVERLNGDVATKRAVLQHAREARAGRARRLATACQDREAAITASVDSVTRRVHRVLVLLKAFDKFKAAPREKAGLEDSPATVATDASKSRRRRSAVATKRAVDIAQESVMTFSFMENERLVRILLRNIKSAEHLKTLEGVLDKHEKNSATLHGVVASIDHALRQYLATAQLLPPREASRSVASAATARSVVPQDALAAGSTLLSVDEQGGGAARLPPSHNNQQRSLYEWLKALMAVKSALAIEHCESGAAAADQTPERNLLEIANTLVQTCFKLFFEATELTDRLSSLQATPSGASGDDDDEGSAPLGDGSFNALLNSEAASAASPSNAEADSEPETGGGNSASVAYAQEKNRHAVQVLKRIEEKLCGQVVVEGDTRSLTVAEQASWLIDEASKADNLCVMYEGWTPWI